MIVRPCHQAGTTVAFRSIAQADHARASGQFAQSWRLGGRPSADAVYAVFHHDDGWGPLDASLRWQPGAKEPYTFLDYPLEERYAANRAGIAGVEAVTPYGAWMCSRHFARLASYLDDDGSKRYVAEETERQARLAAVFTEAEQASAETDFELLRFCDALSLFLCLNEPGEDSWPWYRDGIAFCGGTIRPRWDGRHRLRLDPDPLRAPVEVSLGWDLLGPAGQRLGSETVAVTVGG